ncbi:HTH domain-containing protein [Citrobacter freundii]|uniref:HTH domain-containing protein n=1 Tax=Citrobacter freundii TaxID=546 RepID=UPI0018844284|nr:HTH domain-containing protein [Citrobacter freundii]MBE9980180.1 HTH domain-containing protein [Citrobacter freundii]MBE9989700.1 HTH domain-containing protein [Citrobacter freundii]MBF0068988.1 HTH domain-containing protein [Citrobacter freundii]
MELIQMLYQGKGLRAEDIAQSFGVDIRTAYRDLNRLGNIIEDADDGQKKLAAHLKGQCSVHDLVNVLSKTGTGQLFPVIEKIKLTQLLFDNKSDSCIIKNVNYEESPLLKYNFTCLHDLIKAHQFCSFQYKGSIRCVAPYRLINSKGIWVMTPTY